MEVKKKWWHSRVFLGLFETGGDTFQEAIEELFNELKDDRMYVLPRDIFYANKSKMDGKIFWKQHPVFVNQILIKLVFPDKEIEELLIGLCKKKVFESD